MKENKDNIENVERTQNLESLKKLNIVGKLKLKIREIKNGVKTNLHKFKELDKKELFTNIFSSRYFFLFMFIVILLKTLLFSIDTVFYKHGIWLWYIRQTAFFIIIMLAPMFLFRNSRTRFIYGMILNLVLSCLLFADELYYEYASNIISVIQAGNLQYKDEIISAIPGLLHVRQILYFIDFPIIIVLLLLKKIKIKKVKQFKFKPAIIMGFVIVILCTHYHFVPESIELVTGFIYNKQNSVRYGTIYGYHFVDIKNAITHNKNTKYNSYDDMISVYNEFKKDQSEENPENVIYKGIAENKNVIILQLEAVQNFVVDKTINGKEITPNLNKFLHENINITNMHSTSYTTTADSEHSVITSLYPLENGEAFSKYYGNTYDNIFSLFKKAGYYTMYAHGNYAYFWNRENVTSKLPIDNKRFLEDFEDTSELIRTYLSDELLYKQTVNYFENAIKEQNMPVVYDIVAASSHTPFELAGIKDKSSKISIDIGDLAETKLGYYLEAVNYADYAFGIFIDLLKEKGLYDDTVIIVFGDHYGMQMYDEDLKDYLGLGGDNYNDAMMQHQFSNVICGMKIPEIQNLVIDEPVSKSDVKPTFAQICNLEDTFSMGTSIFNRNSYVTINNGKIITKKYYYDGNKWFILENGDALDMNSLSEEENEVLKSYVTKSLQEIDISNSVIINNLLKDNLN
ncbi:MAG: sulfatase-like hydrolase/transferase [Clostridia bacterium]|nr:sulfatase-like hydrolase/transferase [Clostridia bacterium]